MKVKAFFVNLLLYVKTRIPISNFFCYKKRLKKTLLIETLLNAAFITSSFSEVFLVLLDNVDVPTSESFSKKPVVLLRISSAVSTKHC